MEPRTSTHPIFALPGALPAMQQLHQSAADAGVDPALRELIALRVSQINGCGFCVHMHSRDLRKAGEADERIDTVAAFRESPWFSDAERAALALAEAVTRVADRSEPVPDDLWAEATAHWDETQVAAILLSAAATGVWNRLNAAVRQPAGAIPS